MTRKRYSAWEVLSDIGGFHDGVVLIVGYFVSPLVSTLFQVDLLQRTMIARKEQQSQRHTRLKMAKYLQAKAGFDDWTSLDKHATLSSTVSQVV